MEVLVTTSIMMNIKSPSITKPSMIRKKVAIFRSRVSSSLLITQGLSLSKITKSQREDCPVHLIHLTSNRHKPSNRLRKLKVSKVK